MLRLLSGGILMRAHRGVFAIVAVLVPSLVPVVAGHSVAGATALPRLTVGDVKVAEGDAGKIVVRVPIDLDIAAPAKVLVTWKVTGGTATPRRDFLSPVSGVRIGKSTIAAKHTEAFVSFTVYGDTTVEPDETAFVDVTSVAGATVTRSRGTLTILNDDAPAGGSSRADTSGIPRLSVGTPVVAEGNAGIRNAPVPVTLSIPAPAPITVTFDTPGTDNTPTGNSCRDANMATVPDVTKTITFKTGQQSAYVNVPVRGNTAVDATTRSVADAAAVVSGGVSDAQPASDIVLLDDDTANDTPQAPPPGTYRVSEPVDGSDPTFPPGIVNGTGCGNPASDGPSISADGRFVAFNSNADNLVGNDTNGSLDVFVKDTWTGNIERVSVAADGTQADNDSQVEQISADGRYVLFQSWADNVVPGDDNGVPDSFLYDRDTGTVERLGDSHLLHYGSGEGASISADDRYVAFDSTAPVTGGCNCPGVFVLDRSTGVTTLASVGPSGQIAAAGWSSISGDGRHVAFISLNATGAPEMYIKDLDSGNLETISVNNAGQDGTGVYGTSPIPAALSYDGQVVAFSGEYCNMGLPSKSCGDGTGIFVDEVWIRDRAAQTTTLASVSSSGAPSTFSTGSRPSLSDDGRYLLFDTSERSFDPDCAAVSDMHVYERDLVAGVTTRVDVISATVPCPLESRTLGMHAMSSDGSFVAYRSIVGPIPSASNPEAVYVTRLW